MADVRAAWGGVVLLVACLLGLVYWFATPASLVGEARGAVVGTFTPQSELGRSAARLRVQLDDGGAVTVTLPMQQPYRVGARVELDIVRRDWPPRTLSYEFNRYVDESNLTN